MGTHPRPHPTLIRNPKRTPNQVNYGVPASIVRDKLRAETGFDPALLDQPDAPAPPGGEEPESEDSDDD